MDDALHEVVRRALAIVAQQGFPGEHHFYLTFRTRHPGVALSRALLARFPEEMTIVLQHQFWGLQVEEEAFSVTLRFGGVKEVLTVPFAALTGFVDPSAAFGLRFSPPEPEPAAAPPAPPAGAGRPEPAPGGAGSVVDINRFRKG